MGKSNKVANIAYNVGTISFCIVAIYIFISVLNIISLIADGYGEEVIISLPWRLGLLTGGLAETGICFVIAEIVQGLDDNNKYLYQCLKLLRKSLNDEENVEKLYDDKLPEL